jgi:hypothetical protein
MLYCVDTNCCRCLIAPSDLTHGCVLLQLRELVPVITPWPKSDQQGEQKRPKHLVLADTITLLKQLQDQVRTRSSGVDLAIPQLVELQHMCPSGKVVKSRYTT